MQLLKSTVFLSTLSVAFASMRCIRWEGSPYKYGLCTGDPNTPDAGRNAPCYSTTPCKLAKIPDGHGGMMEPLEGIGPPCYIFRNKQGKDYTAACPDWPGPP
ncbi:unnamed protein product [Zymoseptoria tritici ST99CH_1A5]|uniref:Secreted protein n=3 Tax=Zymoseptoria tritici TaxID=1047171 RepID=A0A1X7RGC2_ZYMT9|nr:unnamed protein product [Zymoseptoria tritici ST99CH_3D7]SMR42799.1 unnamed protein product [Zymoseptoria tritici ST99CH_1E4]SMY20135.1 unnamed protein product [Zymoseptoria tritici ST99CH_1A5]